MAGWKDRAEKEESGWKSRAESVDEIVAESPQTTEGTIETIGRAFNPLNWPENLAYGLSKVDEYTGAPVRKLVTETLTGDELDRAPTGKEQARMLGFTDKPYSETLGIEEYVPDVLDVSPAGVMGLGLEVIQDPLNLAGAAVRGISKVSEPVKQAASRVRGSLDQYQTAKTSAESAAEATARAEIKPFSIQTRANLFREKPPQSLEELRAWAPSSTSDLPGKSRLRQIDENLIDLETRPLKYHYTMMENPKAMKKMKLEFEALPSDDAQKIAAYNQAMVNEAEAKIKSTIDEIIPVTEEELVSGVYKQPKALPDAGLDFISKTKEKFTNEKEVLSPLFEELKQAPPIPPEESRDLILAVAENTKLNKIMKTNEEGRLVLGKNTPRTGISDEEYSVLSRVVDDLNDGVTFKELQDIRDFLRKYIDPANPSAMSEVGAVRSILLDQMENLSGSFGKSTKDVFKRYAINERSRENIEKIIGGQLENLDKIYSANPDKVVNKIFANPNYVEIVKEYLGEDFIKEMVASKVKSGFDLAYDPAVGFKPHIFKKWLSSNKNFLDKNVPKETYQRLTDLADYGYYGRRFLDDVNPSGTAAALLKSVEPMDIVSDFSSKGLVGGATAQTAGRVKGAFKQRQAQKFFSEAIGDTPKGQSFGLGNLTDKLPSMSGVADFAEKSVIPQALMRNYVPSPYKMQQQVIKDTNMTPSQKAKAMLEIGRMAK